MDFSEEKVCTLTQFIFGFSVWNKYDSYHKKKRLEMEDIYCQYTGHVLQEHTQVAAVFLCKARIV